MECRVSTVSTVMRNSHDRRGLHDRHPMLVGRIDRNMHSEMLGQVHHVGTMRIRFELHVGSSHWNLQTRLRHLRPKIDLHIGYHVPLERQQYLRSPLLLHLRRLEKLFARRHVHVGFYKQHLPRFLRQQSVCGKLLLSFDVHVGLHKLELPHALLVTDSVDLSVRFGMPVDTDVINRRHDDLQRAMSIPLQHFHGLQQ